jgi:hypothetical protein
MGLSKALFFPSGTSGHHLLITWVFHHLEEEPGRKSPGHFSLESPRLLPNLKRAWQVQQEEEAGSQAALMP